MKNIARLGFVLVCVIAVAACGSSSKSSSPTSASTNAPTSTTGASASPEAKPYVDALVRGLMSSPDKSTGIGTEQAQCTAAAILDTYGVAGLQKAGYTVAELANPNSDGSRLPATPAQLADLGTRLQRCRLGKFIAPSFASGFQGAVRADTNACLTRHIDTDTSARQVLALAILNHNPDRPAARALVDILANCVDFGTLALSGVKNLTPAQRACIGPKMAKSEAFRDAVVDEILGNKPTTAQILRIALDSVSSCLTPQQLSQLQGGGG